MDGDDFTWEGLACPLLEDYAFNFDVSTSFTLLDDHMLDHPSLQVDEYEKPYGKGTEAKVNEKPTRRYGNHGKGKDLRTVIRVLNLDEAEIKAFLKETEEVAEKQHKKRKVMECYDGTPVQPKDTKRVDNTNQPVQSKKRKADYHCQPMQRKDMMRLDHKNQLAVVDNRRIADYDSRFEASRQKLHAAYERVQETKQRRHIQVVDFQILVTEKTRSKAKAKEKPSLRQKLMAMGRKSSKKFPTFSSCIQY